MQEKTQNQFINEVFKTKADSADTRLRVLYLYRILQKYSDENHPLTTKQIIQFMEKEHRIHMHRTSVSEYISLIKAAGIEVISERRQSAQYYLADRAFSIPELKILIDAVDSSKFITEKKSAELTKKLMSFTSIANAESLLRGIHTTGKAKSENEKGYYIVDAVYDAINEERKISFLYYDYSGSKELILKNNGQPYTVSPYDLIWDGDFYYMTGYCDNREAVRVFRVDRIKNQPLILDEKAVVKPRNYDIKRYTQEVFRMYDTDEVHTVRLICENAAMKALIDQFGTKVKTKRLDEETFLAEVSVCIGPTFYQWVFGWGGKIRIAEPAAIRKGYRDMLQTAMNKLDAVEH